MCLPQWQFLFTGFRAAWNLSRKQNSTRVACCHLFRHYWRPKPFFPADRLSLAVLFFFFSAGISSQNWQQVEMTASSEVVGKLHVQEGLRAILDVLLGGFRPNNCLWSLGYVMLQSATFSWWSKPGRLWGGRRKGLLHHIAARQPRSQSFPHRRSEREARAGGRWDVVPARSQDIVWACI